MDLLCFCSILCLLCLCARLFICDLWSPAGKGLTSWLSFVVSTVSCHFPISILGQVWYLIAPLLTLLVAQTTLLETSCHGSIKLFQNMVMMNIKLNGITKCNNMVANILPADPSNDLGGQKVKFQPFQNMVMLHINLMGITNAAAW